MLDISGAFDNVSHRRLRHDLRKRQVPLPLINWIASFLSDRYTTLELPEFSRPREQVHTGIPQGSPLSPILYLFYNADMMGQKQHSVNFGYIDDTSMLATGPSVAANCRSLALAFQECDQWAAKHASVFAPEKFALVHFECPREHHRSNVARARALAPGESPVTISDSDLDLGQGRIVKPSESAKLLGVLLDSQLRFADHLSQIDRKCSKSLQAISALGRSKWGLGTKGVVRFFGLDAPRHARHAVWPQAPTSNSHGNPTPGSPRHLRSVQNGL